MSEMSLPDNSDSSPISIKQETSTPQQSTSEQDSEEKTFWLSFRVFSSAFEESFFRRWLLLLSGFFVSLLILNFIEDLYINYLYYHNPWAFFLDQDIFIFSKTMYFITSWHYNLFIAGMFLALPLFYNFQKGIPKFFKTLEQKNNLAGFYKDPSKYEHFLGEYQQTLLSGNAGIGKFRIFTRPNVTRALIFLGIMGICLWWILFVIPYAKYNGTHVWMISEGLMFPKTIPYGFTWNTLVDGLEALIIETLSSLLLLYLSIGVIWVLGTTGLYLRKFSQEFDLIIQPGHVDGCGGLKYIGDFALRMALIILMVAFFLAFYSLWRGFSIWSIFTSFLLFAFLVLAYFSFVAPLWKIHLKMLDFRSTYEDAYTKSIMKVESEMFTALNEGDLNKIKEAKDHNELVQALHPDKVGYSIWPFDRRTIITFLTPQIVPVIGLIVGLSQPVSEALKGFFSILSGGHP